MKRLLLALAVTLVAPTVHAEEDRAACREAFEKSQVLKDEGKLTAARQKLVQCTRVCPAGFQKPCEQWLAEVEASLPSIVVRAADERGQDLAAVTVTLDGARVAERLEGKSIVVDPGQHTLHLEAAGRAAVDKAIVVGQGEKNRIVLVTIPGARDEANRAETSIPVAAVVAGAVGVVALGGFAYFGLKGNADHDELVSGCSKTASCAQEDKDRVVREWLVADVFLAAGIVGLGVGTYLWLTHDARIEVRPSRGGAAAALRFAF